MAQTPPTQDGRLLLQRQTLPREVPAALRLGVLLGGGLSQTGWIVLGVGMIFFWTFGLNADLASVLHFRGELDTARGQVTETRKTNVSVGGSKHRRGTPVYANAYSFRTSDGTERRSTSYATGQSLTPGQTVTVEYPRGNPDLSRIRGMRTALFPAWTAVFIAVPAVGILLTLAGLRIGARRNWLLANGRLAWGTLKSKEPTGATVNKRPVYKFTFEFKVNNRSHEVTARTHKIENLAGPEELILHDPRDPSRATLADALPLQVTFDDRGRIASHSRAAWPLILPALTVLGHGLYAYLAYVHFA